jgi:hypothetical protein
MVALFQLGIEGFGAKSWLTKGYHVERIAMSLSISWSANEFLEV